MENAFKVGDVVELKSGGPKMAVDRVYNDIRTEKPNGIVKCIWFEGTKLNFADFKSDTLKVST